MGLIGAAVADWQGGALVFKHGVNVPSDAYPRQVFQSRVTCVDPKIDPATRTEQVRIKMANPQQMQIGMFVNVAFGALGTAEKTMRVVPKERILSPFFTQETATLRAWFPFQVKAMEDGIDNSLDTLNVYKANHW